MLRPRRYSKQRAVKELKIPKKKVMNINEARQPPTSTAKTSVYNQPAPKHSCFNGNKQFYATNKNINNSSETSINRSERRKWTVPETVAADTPKSGFVFKYIHHNDPFIPSTQNIEQNPMPLSGFRVILDSRTADTGVQSTPTCYVAESQTNPSRLSCNAIQSCNTDVRSIGCGRNTSPTFVQSSVTKIKPLNHSSSLSIEACNSSEGMECPKRCPSDCAMTAPNYEINTAYKYYTHMLLQQLHKMRSSLKRHLSVSKCSCPSYYRCRNESGTTTPRQISSELCKEGLRKDEAVDNSNKRDSNLKRVSLEKEDMKSIEQSSSYLMICSPSCPHRKSKDIIVHTVRRNSAFTMRSQSCSSSVIPYASHENIVESLVRTIYIQDGKMKSKIKINEMSTGFVQTLKQSDHLHSEFMQ